MTRRRPGLPRAFLPRALHPGAWWVWALGLATAASWTTNPLLLAVVVVVAGFVVASRRTEAPWARSYGAFLRLGLIVVAIRVVMTAVFGQPLPGRVLVHLPQVALPHWAAGVRLGGDVTLEALASASYAGLRLATLLVCLGAANALSSPSRLLRCVPGALYEVGVAVVVAMTFAPQVVSNVGRVRRARRLRGRPHTGVRGLRGVAMPVLEGALERSLELAAAMDSRGYGRSAGLAPRRRRLTAALTVAGLLGLCAGVFGLLDGGAPPLLGLPILAAGAAVAVVGFVIGGRRVTRSRYRPDRWALPEWLVAGSGIVAAAAVLGTAAVGEPSLTPTTYPLVVPGLPLVPLVGILVALLPAWAAPVPPRPVTVVPAHAREQARAAA